VTLIADRSSVAITFQLNPLANGCQAALLHVRNAADRRPTRCHHHPMVVARNGHESKGTRA